MIYFLGFPLSSDISQPENPLESLLSCLPVEHMKYGAGINWDVNSILPQFWSGPPTTPFSFCTWATNNYLSAPTICQCKGQRNSYCALVKKEELLLFFETKKIPISSLVVSSESERIKPTFKKCQFHFFGTDSKSETSLEPTRCFCGFLKVFWRFFLEKVLLNWTQFPLFLNKENWVWISVAF